MFKPDNDWWFNACLGPLRGETDAYVRGYLHAATVLFETIAESRSLMDTVALPIAFLWRQALELQLKCVIAGTRRLDGDGRGFPTHHKIHDLWSEARCRLETLEPGHDTELDAVAEVISQLAAVDPNSTGFRYATDLAGAPTLASAPDIVNLRNLHDVMREVTTFLECALIEIAKRVDYVN